MSQIKSKKRIQDLAEVYTNDKEIENMLKLVPCSLETTFLEPSCGNGNFLIKIIEKKLKKYPTNKIEIIKSLYGIDICNENIEETKNRIKKYINIDNEEINNILDKNIFCADFLEIDFNKEIDVIVGNPPYQKNDNGFGASAKPLYNLFILKSIQLNPDYISFIIPSRWMFGGKGLDKFRKIMFEDKRLKKIFHINDSKECFPQLNIEGGISYFLWDKNYVGLCEFNQIKENKIISTSNRDLEEFEVFIKDDISIEIIKKIKLKTNDFFDNLIKRPNFGINTNFKNFSKQKTEVILYTTQSKEIVYIDIKFIKNIKDVDKYKVIVSEANGGALKNKMIISKPFIGEKNSVCSQSYLYVPVETKEEANIILEYMKSKPFRFLLSLKKITQHAGVNTYSLIPEKPLPEEEFYKYYELSQNEINFINSKIEKMS